MRVPWMVLAFFLAATPAARAGDGVLEIHQACVAAGCFPGDAPGFPVTAGNDQSLRLTSDLVVPDATTNAISMGNYSTLDLGGFAIRGPVTCGSEIVAACPVATSAASGVSAGSGATIRNGTIRGMGGSGIRAGQATLVERVTVEENAGRGIDANNARSWIIRDSKILRNGGAGIDLAVGGGHALITRNVVVGNGSDGMQVVDSLVLDNAIASNASRGIQMNYANTDSGHGGNVLHYNNGGNDQDQLSGGNVLRPSVCATDAVCP